MKAILLVFLFALVASSELPQYPNPQKFLECAKAGLKESEAVPEVLKALEEVAKTKNILPLLSVGKVNGLKLLELGSKCYQESLSTEVELHNIFSDIGGMLKGLWNDLLSIGKTAWKGVIGEVKSIFDNKGQTLINDIWSGLKATGKEILNNLIGAAKDAIKNLILDALSDPAHAIEHLKEKFKGIPTMVRDTALGVRLPEGCVTAMKIDQIKEIIKGVRTDVRDEVRKAMDQGRTYAIDVCKKLIDTDKVDLCKYVGNF